MFPYDDQGHDFRILDIAELEATPVALQQFTNNRDSLSKRIWFGKNAEQLSGRWYGLMYTDAKASFSNPHILTPSLSDRSNFCLDVGHLFVTGTAGVTSIILNDATKYDIRFVLGILNSQLLSFFAVRQSPVFSGGYYKFSAPYLKNLPIRTIDFTNPADVARHDELVGLVERMLALHAQRAAARTSFDATVLERQIAATDRQIDQLVYALYELTADEVRIVEGTAAT
jgi:hypothetical protein